VKRWLFSKQRKNKPHTNHILWNSGDEQTTEILNNAQWASYVANCTREVEDDSDQSIIMDLVDKENDMWKDDYSLNKEKTNQTTIIGLNNKTLEEDYYSLT
jgi:hypothetical protein